MPRKWISRWFQRKSGVKPNRHGKGRGKSRGLRTRAAVPTPRQVPVPPAQPRPQRVQPPAAVQQPRRRTRTRRQGDGKK